MVGVLLQCHLSSVGAQSCLAILHKICEDLILLKYFQTQHRSAYFPQLEKLLISAKNVFSHSETIVVAQLLIRICRRPLCNSKHPLPTFKIQITSTQKSHSQRGGSLECTGCGERGGPEAINKYL
jgi:hypothetical protein